MINKTGQSLHVPRFKIFLFTVNKTSLEMENIGEKRKKALIVLTAKYEFSFNILNNKILKRDFVKLLTQVCPVNG